ncbi:MAG: flagellar hook-length control protein FliK [Lachnospiraceae bacterium]|nr:flagellar hook-length control protein FliK [Lachnospiraceae bacterium]
MISHFLQTTRTQGTTPALQTPAAQEAALARGQERLSGLSDGQTLQGKLISVSAEPDGTRSAQVDLGGGAVINARISGNMALSAGQDLSFSVSGNAQTGTGVTLRPLYANTAVSQAGLKALSQAGLSANPDTTAMVREMMSEGMSIDRASLLSMNRGVMNYPGHATSIVQMTSLGIPVTGSNIEQFENYKSFEHQVMNAIDTVMDELPDAFEAMKAAGRTGDALDLYGELLGLFAGEEAPDDVPEELTGKAQVQTSEGQEALAAPGQEAQTNVRQTTLPADGQLPVGEGGGTPPDGMKQAAAGETNGISSPSQTASTDKQALSAGSTPVEQTAENNAQTGKASTEAVKDAANVLEAAVKALSDADTTGRLSSPAAVSRDQTFVDLLRQLQIPESVIQNIQTTGGESPAQTELMRALSEAWQKTGHKDTRTDAAWTKLFSTKELGGLIKDAIARDWLLKPADVGKKENVQNLYDRLQNQTSKLAQILSDTHGTNTHLSESVRNLQNNLNFMNDLNHMFQYVQLPLKMNGKNTHGDLYVYANKKNAMHEDGTVSAVLHLDMEHMGPVDVFVKMKDNNVKTNFYLSDDEMIDFLMDHIDILNKRLEKRGYNMDVKMHRQDEEDESPDAPVREMLGGNISHLSALSHTSFDALA